MTKEVRLTKLDAAAPHVDGLINALSGIGTKHDRTTFDRWSGTFARIPDEVLAAMFRGDDMARTICQRKPHEAMRQGFEVRAEDKPNIDDECERLDISVKFVEVATWANLFGGACIVIGARDGQTPDQPLNEKAIERIDWLRVVNKRYIIPRVESVEKDPDKEWYGQATLYDVNPLGTTDHTIVVHVSRLILFRGALTPEENKVENQGWDDSLLQTAYQALTDFARSFAGVNVMMSEANQSVIKIHGLISALASQKQESVTKRMQLINVCRGIARALVLDAESEDFDNKSVSFSGVGEILDRIMMRLSAAVEIPVSILMGRSAAGMNATGDLDVQIFYDHVRTYQKNNMAPRLKRLLRLLFLSKRGPTNGIEPKDWTIHWHSLWQQTPQEAATEQLALAQRDALYIDRDVLLPEEVALARFTDDGFGREVSIDRDLRQAALDQPDKPSPTKPLLNASDLLGVVTMNMVLASLGQELLPEPEGSMTVLEHQLMKEAELKPEPPPAPPAPVLPPDQVPTDPAPDDEDEDA